jgi:orotidine 5'-phosphate decarboxylase subfamily 1
MLPRTKTPTIEPSTKSYTERAALNSNPLAQRIFTLMDTKKTNLCVAADVKTKQELLDLADNVGPHICMLKTHIDILKDFDADTIVKLKALAEKNNFILFEDRKFADIGNTAADQYAGGIYHIADWAQLTNAHTVPGEGIIEALEQVGLDKGNALLLLAEMSSEGNLAYGDYTVKSIEMAKAHPAFVIGFITRRVLTDNEWLLNCTPGIQLGDNKSDGLKQTYITPEEAFAAGTDIQIVGRGIYGKKTAEEQKQAAMDYQKAGWDAYQVRITVQNVLTPTMSLSSSS